MSRVATDEHDDRQSKEDDPKYWETVSVMAMTLRHSAAQLLARRLLEGDIDIAKWIILNVKNE